MKFLTAYQLLESTGMFKIEKVEPINEALDEKTIAATVYIRKEITKSADMRTTAGRRVYHQNARAFGIRESKEEQIREAIEVAKKHGYRVVNEERYFWRDENGKKHTNATQIGSQTVGMFHKDSVKVNHSWTWIDVNAIQKLCRSTASPSLSSISKLRSLRTGTKSPFRALLALTVLMARAALLSCTSLQSPRELG